jgi:hypothetical protein
MNRHGWRNEPDQTYEGSVGNYLQHVYGEKEYGGTQVLKLSGVNFQKSACPICRPMPSRQQCRKPSSTRSTAAC